MTFWRQLLSRLNRPPGSTPGPLPEVGPDSLTPGRLDALDLRLADTQDQLDAIRSGLDVVSKMAMRTERKVYRKGDEDADALPAEPRGNEFNSPYLTRQ